MKQPREKKTEQIRLTFTKSQMAELKSKAKERQMTVTKFLKTHFIPF